MSPGLTTSATPRPAVVRDLEPLFSPRSVAVVGASRQTGSVGYAITQNIIFGGFTGVLYPVNPKARSILGNRCVPSVSAIGEPVDLAVVIVPAAAVEDVIREGVELGTRHFVVISAGFREVGGEGVERERRLRALAEAHDLTIVGPNCFGVINYDPAVRMNATFAREIPAAGVCGLISQSGAVCAVLLDYARGIRLGFSRVISYGNKVAVQETELLRSLAADTNTRVILMYLEELSTGQDFVETCQVITRGPNAKPILAIKTGRTREGATAAASHTGSLAGSDAVYDGVLAQAGVIRVDSVEDLFHYAEAFVDPVLPAGRRTAIVTNAGGPGVIATDSCIRSGLELARFQDYTTKALRYQLPGTSSPKNPLDLIGDAKADRYRAALDAVVADTGVDQVVVVFAPQALSEARQIAEVIRETRALASKPIVACMMGLVDVSAGVELLRASGMPTYTFPEDAMHALAAKCAFVETNRTPVSGPRRFEADSGSVDAVFAAERKAGRTQLVEVRALEVLRGYGFPTVRYTLARSDEEAAAAAREIGFPVVLKIAGPQILHKTEVGGVKLNVRDERAVRAAYGEILDNVRGKLGREVETWGVLVQKMLPPGREVILGSSRDERFGPLLMFGLGGIYTETFRDVSFRLAPLGQSAAHDMIRAIRTFRLLEGVRGEPPSDTDQIAECLLRLSQLVVDHPEIRELDINPLIVYPCGQGAVVSDARIILSED
jgi:acetyltransferase